ncbi:MAG: F0F1 ATP synthase subunit B [Proteobacteria bacterium]|nr:F0F1 ATP synthase subunit B [Pseudomonadota bacterium]
MDKLFTPDVGLMVWTVVTFVILLVILGKFGWRPMIEAIEAREKKLHDERTAAEAARAEAQRIQADLEAKLADIDLKSREALAQAMKDADAFRTKQTGEAQAEAKKILDKGLAELAEEKRRLVAELRQDVAKLAVTAAEKLVHKTVDEGVKKSTLDQFFKELDKPASGGRH